MRVVSVTLSLGRPLRIWLRGFPRYVFTFLNIYMNSARIKGHKYKNTTFVKLKNNCENIQKLKLLSMYLPTNLQCVLFLYANR